MVLSNKESDLSRGRFAKTGETNRFDNSNACAAEAERKITQTIGYMRACLNQPMQVSQLARMANISPSHFFAVFKKRTGFAPMDYFIRMRMEHACEILATTDLSIKEIAAKLGYEDPFYFSRIFKSVNAVAPSEYRELSDDRKRLNRGR